MPTNPTPEEVERWRGVLEDMLEVHWRADDGIVADAFRFALTALDRVATLERERDCLTAGLKEARKWLDKGNARIAAQIIDHTLDPDPWLDAPLTDEERRAVEAATPDSGKPLHGNEPEES